MTVEPWAQVTFQWGQTHRSLFRDSLVGDRTLWNRGTNVETGLSDSSNFSTYRQTLDPIVGLGLTVLQELGKLIMWKEKDLRTDPTPVGISTKVPLDFSLFSGTTVEVSKDQLFQGVSKGTHSRYPSSHFLFEYLLDFWSFGSKFQHFESIFN